MPAEDALRSPFEYLLRPRGVAIVGASPQRGSSRNTLVRVLVKHGFSGAIYPVSASHTEIEGLKAYASVADIPDVPDVALVITPAHTVPEVIAQCGAKGIPGAIVFSSGFEEVENGKELALQLAESARRHKVAVLGPNCQGIWSVRARTMLTFGSALMNLETVQHAPLAVISQSGALAGAIGNTLQTSGIGCSYIVSVGNETCIDALDALAWIIEQEDVKVAAMYIEGLADAGRIMAIAQRARERGVQIVTLKAGRSAMGQQATASHTGKIASSHAVYADALEQAGVITVDSLEDALAAVEVLGYLGNPRRSNDANGGVSILSSSGGAGALLADHSSELGVPMAQFSADTAQQLEKILPEFARKANPVDLTGQINSVPGLFGDTCAAIGADPRTEAVVVQSASSGRRQLMENADALKALAQQVPVVVSFIGEVMEPQLRRDFGEAGIVLSAGPGHTMKALSMIYRRQRAQVLGGPRARTAGSTPLAAPRDWGQAMAVCEQAGIAPAPWVILRPGERAEQACQGLSYPLVVKVLPSESDHKSELGLVKLHVRSAQEVDALCTAFRARLGKPDAGMLVQEMAGDGVEVVLSCLRQTDFGPVISIGSGGVAIELYRDVTSLVLPVTREQVMQAMPRLKLWSLLQGYRGNPAADVQALADAAVRLGDWFLCASEVREFELNPVIVRGRGEGLVAVDALAVAD